MSMQIALPSNCEVLRLRLILTHVLLVLVMFNVACVPWLATVSLVLRQYAKQNDSFDNSNEFNNM